VKVTVYLYSKQYIFRLRLRPTTPPFSSADANLKVMASLGCYPDSLLMSNLVASYPIRQHPDILEETK